MSSTTPVPVRMDDNCVPIDLRIEQARNGSREAMGKLLEDCQRYLLLVANRELTGDLRAKGGASDIVQETFLEAQRDFKRFDGSSEAELIAWLRRLLLNNLSNFSRQFRRTSKRQLGREVSLEMGDSSNMRISIQSNTETPSQCVMASEENQAMLAALERLPAHYRDVILLRHRDGYSYNEIAELLGRTSEAVRKLWTRAVERLHQELEKQDHAGIE